MTYSFFILMALIQNLSAQKSPPVFEEFVIEDGFASVNCIFRDSEGFMWFGGTHGLYRYDGYAFKTFFASDQDSSSLSNNNVVSIFQDREGLI